MKFLNKELKHLSKSLVHKDIRDHTDGLRMTTNKIKQWMLSEVFLKAFFKMPFILNVNWHITYTIRVWIPLDIIIYGPIHCEEVKVIDLREVL